MNAPAEPGLREALDAAPAAALAVAPAPALAPTADGAALLALLPQARAATGGARATSAALQELSGLAPAAFMQALARLTALPCISLAALEQLAPAFDLLSYAEAQSREMLVLRDGARLLAVTADPFNQTRRGWLGSDAVLDAFTNSDFGLGGSNNKRFVVGGSLGIDKNTWVSLRWMASSLIDSMAPRFAGGSPTPTKLGVDLFQVDLNARF